MTRRPLLADRRGAIPVRTVGLVAETLSAPGTVTPESADVGDKASTVDALVRLTTRSAVVVEDCRTCKIKRDTDP